MMVLSSDQFLKEVVMPLEKEALQEKKIKQLRIRLTNKCNAKCSFCHGDGGSMLPPYDYIKIKTIRSFFEKTKMNSEKISLTGGEPLLHPDLSRIVSVCNLYAPNDVHLNTNGLLLDYKLKTIKKLNLSSIHVNINTVNPRLYKDVYGVKKPKKIFKTLCELRDSGFEIAINYVCPGSQLPQNISRFIELSRMCGFDLSIIEDYEHVGNGVDFQFKMFGFLEKKGFAPNYVTAGRVIYNNGYQNVTVAAPCAPAKAWNGMKGDDAIVLNHDGNIRGFYYG